MKKKQSKRGGMPRRHTPAHVRAGRLIRQERARAREKAKKEAGHTFEGVFSGNRRGFGFAEWEKEGVSVFLPAPKTRGALDGDRVEIRCYPSSRERGKWEGEVLKVLETEDYRLTGTLVRERIRGERGGRRYYVSPTSSRLPERIPVERLGGAKEGDRVLLVIPRGREDVYIERSFGPADSLGANYEAILTEAGIREDFDEAALREAETRALAPVDSEGRERVSPFAFTVDSASAKDLDDAVSIEKTEGGWLLGVHIADVSEYVRPKTPLDTAAMERGTSVYFADRVVPMLPPALSNGACSLNAGEDKAVLSAYMELDTAGEILSARVCRGILRSRVRGVYAEINDVLKVGEESPYFEKYRDVYPALLTMREATRALADRAQRHGALDFETPAAYILLDEEGMPTEILPQERGESERMIEQFMLAANRAVATLLHGKSLPCVYRVHEAPVPEKLSDFLTYAHNLGLSTAHIREGKVTAKELALLLAEAEEKGLLRAVSYPLLRAMAKAKYSAEAHGHFGLSFPLYCHFTSPIRRLSDLATHRIVKAVLLDGEAPEKYARYAAKAAEAATEAELRALTAEREIEALYKTLYLSRHVGEEYDATLTSVTSFGAFAELECTAEGLLPIEELPGYFTYDEETLTLRSSKFSLRIADRVRVKVERVDIAARRAIFSLVL